MFLPRGSIEDELVETKNLFTLVALNLDGCDPEKIGTTIPNEEEIAAKHSSLDSQLKTSAALSLSLSLSLDVPVYAQSE